MTTKRWKQHAPREIVAVRRAAGMAVAAVATAITAAAVAKPPAASVAFISADPLVVEIRSKLETHDLAELEQAVRQAMPAADPDNRRGREELAEIIRRLRHEYSLDAAGLVEAVQGVVDTATAEEVTAWAAEAGLRTRLIDGQRRFHRRAVQNMFLFSPAARDRRDAARPPRVKTWRLEDHVQEVIAAADEAGRSAVLPFHQRIRHTITVDPADPSITPGSRIRVWLPFPQEGELQRHVRLIKTEPAPAQVAPPGRLEPSVAGSLQRSVCIETVVEDPPQPLVFSEEFELVTLASYRELSPAAARPLPADWGGSYLEERPPHIVFTPEIRAAVNEIVGSSTNPLERARLLFRWVSESIPWHAEDEYSTIPSLAVQGFRNRRGDCGVQNSLFITMCRIAGIPARWQSGFQTRPELGVGMHDWAEIYIAPWGWLPADASYGMQPAADPRVAYFFCGGRDSHRITINLDWGRELWPPLSGLRAEPADFQRGEVEVDGKPLYFDAWSSQTTIVQEPWVPDDEPADAGRPREGRMPGSDAASPGE